MAFVASSFIGAAVQLRPCKVCPYVDKPPPTILAASSDKRSDSSGRNSSGSPSDPTNFTGFGQFRGNIRRRSNGSNRPHHPSQFQHFDGSVPLLPPWRPDTLEQDFTYASARVHRPASRDDAWTRNLVRLDCPGHATLYAHVVQYSEKDNGVTSPPGDTDSRRTQKVWLRPLLLDSQEQTETDADTNGFLDLRGLSDLVVHSRFVAPIDDPVVALSIRLNLAATNPDVATRVTLDDDGTFSRVASDTLFDFVRRLYDSEGTFGN